MFQSKWYLFMMLIHRKLQHLRYTLISIVAACSKNLWILNQIKWWIFVQIQVDFSMTSSPFGRFHCKKTTLFDLKESTLLYNPGEKFLEGLLVNGCITRLVMTRARGETFICKWTLNLCACLTLASSFFISTSFSLPLWFWCLGLISVVFIKRRFKIICLWLLVFHTVITKQGVLSFLSWDSMAYLHYVLIEADSLV